MQYRISVHNHKEDLPVIIYADPHVVGTKTQWYIDHFPECTISVSPARTVGDLLRKHGS